MNKSTLIGFKIRTPTFQPRSAMRPGKITMKSMSYRTANTSCIVGASTPPNAVVMRTTTVAAVVPNRQESVEYRKVDQSGKRSPPIVYKTQPMTAMNKINNGKSFLSIVNKKSMSPFVTTRNTPIKARPMKDKVYKLGRCFLKAQMIKTEIIGMSDSIIEASNTPDSPSISGPQKINKLYTANPIEKNHRGNFFPSILKACLPSFIHKMMTSIIATGIYRKMVK